MCAKAPQEIIAAQIGNQYFLSTVTQLQLGLSRSMQDNWVPLAWFLFNVELLSTGANRAPVYQAVSRGKPEAKVACAKIKRNKDGNIVELQIPSCPTLKITWKTDGSLPNSFDPPNWECSSPNFSNTRRRISSPRHSRSNAVAVPALIIKLQCFSDICAPPI